MRLDLVGASGGGVDLLVEKQNSRGGLVRRDMVARRTGKRLMRRPERAPGGPAGMRWELGKRSGVEGTRGESDEGGERKRLG